MSDKILPPIQSLEFNPKINAPQFLRDAASAAAASCPALGGLLAMGVLDTDLQWLLKHPALPDPVDPEQMLPPTPKPIPQRPGALQQNANANQRQAHTEMRVNHTDYTTGYGQLKTALLSSAGSIIRKELEHPENGHANVTCDAIVARVQLRYADMTDTDLRKLGDSIRVLPEGTSIAAFVVQSAAAHAVFFINRQPKSEFDKCESFEAAISGRHHLTQLVSHYKLAEPRATARTFEAMSKYVEDHESTVTASDSAYGSGFHANAMSTYTAGEWRRDRDLYAAHNTGYESFKANPGQGPGATGYDPNFDHPPPRDLPPSAQREIFHLAHDALAFHARDMNEKIESRIDNLTKTVELVLTTMQQAIKLVQPQTSTVPAAQPLTNAQGGWKKYCFKCGTQKDHTGRGCSDMAADKGTYSTTMRNAVEQCTIDGVLGAK